MLPCPHTTQLPAMHVFSKKLFLSFDLFFAHSVGGGWSEGKLTVWDFKILLGVSWHPDMDRFYVLAKFSFHRMFVNSTFLHY